MQSDHDCDVGLGAEILVFGESQDETLEHLVGDGDSGLPEDEAQVERR